MKKFASLALTAVLATSLLAGCGARTGVDAESTGGFASSTPTADANAEGFFSKAVEDYVNHFFGEYDKDSDGKITIGKKVLASWGKYDIVAMADNWNSKKESMQLVVHGNFNVVCGDIQPLLAAADADKDGAATKEELAGFIKATFDKNTNGKLGIIERIRFRFSQYHERTKRMNRGLLKFLASTDSLRKFEDSGFANPIEKPEDVDTSYQPSAEEQEKLSS